MCPQIIISSKYCESIIKTWVSQEGSITTKIQVTLIIRQSIVPG